MYNYVRTRLADESATEDVVAEAFLRAARYFEKFDSSRASFSTWVTTIAINCMRDYWRRAKPTSSLDDVPDSVAAQAPEQDSVDDRDMVDRLLSVLAPDERNIIVMKYREGYRNVQIAEILGMNASTVSTKVAKAVAKMRAALPAE